MKGFIKLPVRMIDRQLTDLGIEIGGEPDFWYFNPNHIAAFNRNSDMNGEQVVEILINGERVLIYMPFEDFIQLLKNDRNTYDSADSIRY